MEVNWLSAWLLKESSFKGFESRFAIKFFYSGLPLGDECVIYNFFLKGKNTINRCDNKYNWLMSTT